MHIWASLRGLNGLLNIEGPEEGRKEMLGGDLGEEERELCKYSA